MVDSTEKGIPGDTIARVFETCSFTQDDTRITEDTVMLVEKYMRLFIREAALRSLENKEVLNDVKAENPVLQHGDLERISGVLLLDL
ncbi:HGL299Wp [Eremothecium sinecaudum]|uniref:HGL299Wp n=1 Tax=Eremothecium sinecaudum TaxID=45286 RepID=A0A0X8HV20_9SACH|nr:HGL299Wp [Eremothecium sinecaudum]AMD22041.1 HGL299Wp [Eremothecium sinecaudum]